MPNLDAAGNEPLQGDVDRVVVTRDEIADRVAELAVRIEEHYRRAEGGDEGPEITVLAVLTGALVFLSDLIRRLSLAVKVKVVSASSYPGPRTSPDGLELRMLPEASLAGRNVLVVDDILDTGRTLATIVQAVQRQRPGSVKTCVLLAKDRHDLPERIRADFVGFHVAPEFVVGYGLDFDDLYRNLPDICTLKGGVLARRGGRHVEEGRP